jgi:hypothetical protein
MNGDLKVRRIGVSESVNRRSVDVKGSGNVGNGFAFQNKPTCQLFLICAQFSRTPESDPSFSSGVSPRTCSLSYRKTDPCRCGSGKKHKVALSHPQALSQPSRSVCFLPESLPVSNKRAQPLG